MGISGGLDSAYLAYVGAKKWGLRICAVHIDDGFDTDMAVQNIKRICNHCNIKLITIKPDKEQYLNLIRAFIKVTYTNPIAVVLTLQSLKTIYYWQYYINMLKSTI